jgi:hypothetical protein
MSFLEWESVSVHWAERRQEVQFRREERTVKTESKSEDGQGSAAALPLCSSAGCPFLHSGQHTPDLSPPISYFQATFHTQATSDLCDLCIIVRAFSRSIQ